MADKAAVVHSSVVDRSKDPRGLLPCGINRAKGPLVAGADSDQITCAKCKAATK